MIRTRIFQKYFLLAFTLLIAFVFFGFYFNAFLIKALMPARPEMMPPIFMARVIDRINPKDKIKAIEEFTSWRNEGPGPQLVLINESGEVLFPKDYPIDFNWGQVQKPLKPYDYTSIEKKAPDDKPPGPFFMPGPPGPNPGEPRKNTLIRLADEKPLYLLIPPPGPPGPGMGKDPHMHSPLFPFIGLVSLLVSLFLGVGVTISIIYYSVKKNVTVIDDVILELKNGNLKARLPIQRKDEFGQAMQRFNYMADEIEKLVNGLKTVEQARTKLLQELAHDLRTPIASLKNLIETLDSAKNKLDPHVQKELMSLSLKEIDYFERLVEDLLFLAQVREPAYQAQQNKVATTDILTEECDDCLLRYEHQGKQIKLEHNLDTNSSTIHGDSYLIRRLIRNVLENAFSFAQNKIKVTVATDTTKLTIKIEDDGPGFSKEGLESFGQRRVTRKLDSKPDGRLSVGLGSVVMKAIAEVHRGKVIAQNHKDRADKILGAVVTIELPIS